MKVTATDVCRALAADADPDSGWVRWAKTREVLEPREVWLAGAGMWVRESGRYVSGWTSGRHFGVRFYLLDAFRIRRAVKGWAARNPAK